MSSISDLLRSAEFWSEKIKKNTFNLDCTIACIFLSKPGKDTLIPKKKFSKLYIVVVIPFAFAANS